MKKQALRKDFWMEIRLSWNRFLSILLIVALGVSFFSGIRAAEWDMRASLDEFFDEKELFDVRIQSTAGLDADDRKALSDLNVVDLAKGGYSQDVFCDIEKNQKVLKVMSKQKQQDPLNLQEGRLPKKADECVLDAVFAERNGLKIGDTLNVYLDKDDTDLLKEHRFRICGLGYSSEYIAFERGNSVIGQGEVDAYVIVLEEAFASEYYTQIDLRVKDAPKEIAYTDAYQKKIDKVIDKIKKEVEGERVQAAKDRLRIKYQKGIEEGERKLEDARRQLKQGQKQYEIGLSQLEMAHMYLLIDEASYQEQYGQLEEARQQLEDAEEEITSREQELNEKRQEMNDLSVRWYVKDRTCLPQYDQGGENADRIAAIGKVFPVIFFLVAALISLTTMTRMVEEERTQIGILKALGYEKRSILAKYFWYAFLATVLGSVIGILIGEKLIPYIIVISYQIMYPGIPNVVVPYEWKYSMLAMAVSLLCTIGATVAACYQELASQPSVLMRPVAPKGGKRILLERITVLWSRLSFIQKSTLRNLFRYKKRFFMTIFGIGGCMGLMIFGFGLKDSIFRIADLQYGELTRYQAMLHIDEKKEIRPLVEELEKEKDLSFFAKVYMTSHHFETERKGIDAYLFVPETAEDLSKYLTLRRPKTRAHCELPEDGVILTEKMADAMGVKAGDEIRMELDGNTCKWKVADIAENYMYHYVYVSRAYYEKVTKKSFVTNTILCQSDDLDEKGLKKIGKKVLQKYPVRGVTYLSNMQEQLDQMLKSLDIVIVVIVGAAGLLAFVVLYNLNNININERKRELATIKVLGFYLEELASYVYRENILLTLVGMVVGAVFGRLLHRFIIVTVEIDTCMFCRDLTWSSYVYSGLLTIGFALLINLSMLWKLKRIDMIESLKSIE